MTHIVLRLDDAGRKEAARVIATNQRAEYFIGNTEIERFYQRYQRGRNVIIDRRDEQLRLDVDERPRKPNHRMVGAERNG